jgi:antibiotic biosynthesis monooxygenase (ABM) superfamily enzyme
MIAVYPCSLAISTWGAPALASFSVYLGTLLTSVAMVALMTYVFVPILTTFFQGWLGVALSE